MIESEKPLNPPKSTGHDFLDLVLRAEFIDATKNPVPHIKPTSTVPVPRGYWTQEMVRIAEGLDKVKPKQRKKYKRKNSL